MQTLQVFGLERTVKVAVQVVIGSCMYFGQNAYCVTLPMTP